MEVQLLVPNSNHDFNSYTQDEPVIIRAIQNEPIGLVCEGPQQAELVNENGMLQVEEGHDTICVLLTSHRIWTPRMPRGPQDVSRHARTLVHQ